MYPYHLGCHLKSGRLCRIPHPGFGFGIPAGFVRIVKYKTYTFYRWIDPYLATEELESKFWSLPRWTDIQQELGEKRTGPNMFQYFSQVDPLFESTLARTTTEK